MTTDQLIAILGITFGGVVGVVSPVYAARSADKLQSRELTSQRDELELTLAADRLKTLIEERRKLLDEGALLLVDVDDGLDALRARDWKTTPEQSAEWDELVKKLTRFRARLTLWFDEGSEVITAFTGVLNDIGWYQSSFAGEVHADEEFRKILAEAPDRDGSDELAKMDRQLSEKKANAAKRVDAARLKYTRAARAYLAGEAPEARVQRPAI